MLVPYTLTEANFWKPEIRKVEKTPGRKRGMVNRASNNGVGRTEREKEVKGKNTCCFCILL